MPRVIVSLQWRLRSFLRRLDDLGGAIEQKNPICFFCRYYRSDKSQVIADETSVRKTPHEEEINFPSEIYFLLLRSKRAISSRSLGLAEGGETPK